MIYRKQTASITQTACPSIGEPRNLSKNHHHSTLHLTLIQKFVAVFMLFFAFGLLCTKLWSQVREISLVFQTRPDNERRIHLVKTGESNGSVGSVLSVRWARPINVIGRDWIESVESVGPVEFGLSGSVELVGAIGSVEFILDPHKMSLNWLTRHLYLKNLTEISVSWANFAQV